MLDVWNCLPYEAFESFRGTEPSIPLPSHTDTHPQTQKHTERTWQRAVGGCAEESGPALKGPFLRGDDMPESEKKSGTFVYCTIYNLICTQGLNPSRISDDNGSMSPVI